MYAFLGRVALLVFSGQHILSNRFEFFLMPAGLIIQKKLLLPPAKAIFFDRSLLVCGQLESVAGILIQ